MHRLNYIIGSHSAEFLKHIFRKSNKRRLYILVHMNILFPNFVSCCVISLDFSLYQCFQNHEWSPKWTKLGTDNEIDQD